MKIVNYLHVSLKLNNSDYNPYHKPDNKIFYILKDSITHPASLKKSPHRLKKEFPPFHLTKPHLINQKIPKKLLKNPAIGKL